MNALFAQALEAGSAGSTRPGRRRAALLLHGMDAGDRAWTLGRLSAPERAEIEPLLRELEAMGVPADAAWVQEGLVDERPPLDAAATSPRQRIEAAAAEHVMAALAAEPPALVERLLALGPWPWQGQLQRAWTDRRFESVGSAMSPASSDGTARALDRALLTRLAERLDACRDPARGGSDPRSRFAPWSRIRRLLHSMARRTR